MVIRALHISDLHARSDWTDDQQEIVQAMLDDAEKLADTVPIDLMVFSGDLAHDGGPEQYALATEVLLDPLTDRLGIPRERMLIIPGNHDVHRPSIDAIYELGLQQALADRESVNRLLDDATERQRACSRLSNFHAFHAAFFADDPPEPVSPLAATRRFDVRGVHVGMLGLNSAWRSSGDHDHGRLLIGDRQLRNGLQAIEGDDLRLVTVHHPLDWLSRFDTASARLMLEQSGAIVLTGHEHAANPTSEITMRGQAVYNRVGCLYETHRYTNSYTLIDADLDQEILELNIRTWWPDGRRSFAPAVHLAPEGRLSFPLPAPPRRPRSARRVVPAVPTPTLPGPDDALLAPPEELRQAALRAYTPLYKTNNTYSFEVLDDEPRDEILRVKLGFAYGLVNPTPVRLGHRPGITPVRPMQLTAVTVDREPVDMTNPDIYTERGVIVPITIEPQSETQIALEAIIDYRFPDSEVFLTYLPSLSFNVKLKYDPNVVRFIGEALMPESLNRSEQALDTSDHVLTIYEAKGPVLSYWGIKLDWHRAEPHNPPNTTPFRK